MYNRKYDKLLTSVFRSQINQLNAQFVKPFDITSLDPQTLPFLSNMLTNLHLSPFIQNEFMYFGFSYFMDQSPQTRQSFNHMTDSLAQKHGDKIVMILDKVTAYFE